MAGKKPKVSYEPDLGKYLQQMMGDPTGKALANATLKYMGFFDTFSQSVVKTSGNTSKQMAANYATTMDSLLGDTEKSIDKMQKVTSVSLGNVLGGVTEKVRR